MGSREREHAVEQCWSWQLATLSGARHSHAGLQRRVLPLDKALLNVHIKLRLVHLACRILTAKLRVGSSEQVGGSQVKAMSRMSVAQMRAGRLWCMGSLAHQAHVDERIEGHNVVKMRGCSIYA